MYKITVTDPAQRDLAEAITYISKELKNRQAAVDLLNSVDKAVRSLSDMPERYAVIDDEILGAAGFRFIKIKSYLLFYIVRNESKTVVIQRFLYARRNWLNILKSNTSAE